MFSGVKESLALYYKHIVSSHFHISKVHSFKIMELHLLPNILLFVAQYRVVTAFILPIHPVTELRSVQGKSQAHTSLLPIEWVAPVSIGDQDFFLLIDTGSSTLLVDVSSE